MIQVYTGNGKGKTTAAIGLAIRAVGAGNRVYFGQFVKKGCYHEIKLLRKIRKIKLEQFGRGCFIKSPLKEDIALARNGLRKIRQALAGRAYGVVVLDEVNIALNLGLLELDEVIALLKSAPKKIEIILTGRNAHPQIIKMADLVSEMKDVKHYYAKNIKARKGIEY